MDTHIYIGRYSHNIYIYIYISVCILNICNIYIILNLEYIYIYTRVCVCVCVCVCVYAYSLVAQTVKESVRNVGDPGLIPGSGQSSGEGNGSPLQYSCLENSMDRGAWWATVHGVTKSRTLSSSLSHACMSICPLHDTVIMSFTHEGTEAQRG